MIQDLSDLIHGLLLRFVVGTDDEFRKEAHDQELHAQNHEQNRQQ